MALTTLQTARLILRPFEVNDLDAYAEFMTDPEVVRYIGGVTLSRDEVAERISQWRARFERDGFGLFALVRREDARLVGRCGLLVWEVPAWTVTTRAEARGAYELELGWTLGRPYWGNGYATEAARAVRDHAFGELAQGRLISLIATANLASAAVARRLGMTIERGIVLHELPVDVWSLRA